MPAILTRQAALWTAFLALVALVVVAALFFLARGPSHALTGPLSAQSPTAAAASTASLNSTSSATNPADPTAPATYYVSKNGSNSDGRTWATAWNELNQINWSVVLPGDTILVDGGSSQMTYTTPLVVSKSGLSAAPITIRLAPDAGRNGQAVFFGGRSTPLPYCDQPTYTFQTQGVSNTGIELGSTSWVVVDGTKWKGIVVYGNDQYGVHLDKASSNVTVRNLEIYDNGKAWLSDSTHAWRPDQPGVSLSGSDNVFERDIIHDNGQDSFQSSGGFANVTIRQSWLYNSRPHPSDPALSFNFCMHSDGIQVYDGGVMSGVTIEESVLGPGLMQGMLLGQAPSNGSSAQVDNVTLNNLLILDTTNANIMGYPTVQSRNWIMQHITSFHTAYDPDGPPHSAIFLEGSGHNISDSIFYGGTDYLPGGATVSDNIQFNNTGFSLGTVADPLFVGAPAYNSTPTLQDLINGDYALRSGSPAAGKGSSITSVAQLLGLAPNAGTDLASPTAPVTSAPPTPIDLNAGEGQIPAPSGGGGGGGRMAEFDLGLNLHMGSSAAYSFSVDKGGDYILSALIASPREIPGSLSVNIDAAPTGEEMAWDIGSASGFVWKTVSWRGKGTAGSPQDNPRVFHLSAGRHTLILRGLQSAMSVATIRFDAYRQP